MYENANDDEQQYIQNLALFLTGFLGVHLKVSNREMSNIIFTLFCLRTNTAERMFNTQLFCNTIH
jgi:hypothetical protein